MYLFINKDTARKILDYLIKFIWLVHLCTKHSLHCQINLKHITCLITSYSKNQTVQNTKLLIMMKKLVK